MQLLVVSCCTLSPRVSTNLSSIDCSKAASRNFAKLSFSTWVSHRESCGCPIGAGSVQFELTNRAVKTSSVEVVHTKPIGLPFVELKVELVNVTGDSDVALWRVRHGFNLHHWDIPFCHGSEIKTTVVIPSFFVGAWAESIPSCWPLFVRCSRRCHVTHRAVVYCLCVAKDDQGRNCG
jgi:hypothetical protein